MASGRRVDLDTSYNESCPLLQDQSTLETQKLAKSKRTPLPKAQLTVLCAVRLVDPIAFSQIFPYINEFMITLHLTDDPSQIGFYSGIVESAFALAQLCSIYQWAKLSDIIGRRPVIIVGIIGIAVTTVLFGLSDSLTEVLISRCIAGLFSGNIAVIHSVLGELTDPTNQALAFPIYGLAWPLGSIIGPLIGGTLSNPAAKYPGYFDYAFLRIHPYFLPCAIAALVAILAVLLAFYFLDETLPTKRRKRTEKGTSLSGSFYGPIDNGNDSLAAAQPPSVKNLLSIPIIRSLSASGCALSFIATAFDVVFVLFCYSPIETGGLAFSASQIGYSLAIAGSTSACIQLFFMPTLLRTFDIVRLYNFCIGLWPFAYIALPLLNFIARSGLNETTGQTDVPTKSILWIGIAIVLAGSRIGCLAYSVSMILVKENSPSPSALGSTNGLVQFAMCLSRAFSPAFVSSAFALSVNNNLCGGYLWVIIMVVICLLGCFSAKSIITQGSETSVR